MSEQTNWGKVEISPKVVAAIAGNAVLSSYGVVGLGSKNIADGLVQALQREGARGVDVHVQGDKIVIDVYVIIEYGTRIFSVAHSIMNVVRYNVERSLGVPVERVNVHVQGLRVSNTD
jgi:uncharacterized alkaline shock family protein YloU